MKKNIVVIALAAALLSSHASANDSSAAIGLGGLELTQNDAISMDSEDLYLSLDKVTVKYRFTNRSDRDVETLISFPLPAIPNGINGPLGDSSYPDWKDIGFKTLVDGKAIALDYRERVTANGQNVEKRLKELGWPVRFWEQDFDARIEKMSDAEKAQYLAEGLLRKPDPEYDRLEAAWQVATHITRTQKFPAGKTVTVEHSYQPVAGGSVGGILDRSYRNQKDSGFPGYAKHYCIDNAFLKGFDKKRYSRLPGLKKGEEAEYAGWFYVEHWLSYVLKSGANWRGPIKDFRLVVDKGKPDRLLSLCMDGVKKISPTRFEVRRTNFEPTTDIDVLIVQFLDPRGN
jgi:hypothetical protein